MNAQDNSQLLFAIFLLMVFALGGAWLLKLTRQHREAYQWQVRLFLIALLARFAASVVIYEMGLVRVLGDEDSSGWANGAGMLADWTRRHYSLFDLPAALAPAFEQHHQGYYYLLGLLFYFTDAPGRMPAAALNCFFGALTVIFIYRVARSLFSPWVAAHVGWAACFFPSMIVWSAQTVKEPVVIMLEVVALYACVHLKLTGFSLKYALLCGASILLLWPFRFYAAYMAGVAAMIALILPQLSKRKLSVHSGVAVAVLVIPLALSSGILARSQAQIEAFNVKTVENFRRNISSGTGSGVESRYNLNSGSGLLLATTVGAAHLLLAPFPWQLGGASLRMLLVMPEMLVWWWMFFAGLIPGVRYAIKHRFSELQPFFFFVAGLGLLYSMMFGNVGLIVRQRTQLLPMLFVLVMVGLEQRALKQRALRQRAPGAPALAQT